VLDVDCKPNREGVKAPGFESLAELEERNGKLPRTYTVRTPSGGTHFYFNVEAPPEWLTNSAGKLGPGLDVRAGGKGYVAAPGTTLPEGGYELVDDVDPAPCPPWLLAALKPAKRAPEAAANLLPSVGVPAVDRYAQRALESATAKVATAAEGGRNDTLNAEAFGLYRLVGAGRLQEAHVTTAMQRAATGCGLDSAEIQRTLASARERGLASPNTEGVPKAADGLALPRMVIAATAGEARRETPRALPSSLLPVPSLPLGALPGAFGDWIGDVSERSNCPPDYVALPMLVGAGMLLARHCALRPKRLDSWAVIPNVWGCIVGPPGAMKSPAMKQGLFALDRMEQAARASYVAAMQAFNVEAAAEKLRAEESAKAARKALAKDRDADVRHLLTPDDADKTPGETRYLVTDATVEKLGEILAANPGGVVYARDELGSLFRTLAREEQAAARGFLLTAWDGGRYRFDRITRGTVEIPNARVAVIGSIQPGPLSAMVREASGTGDDGLLQRPLFAWPDQSGQWTDVDRFPNSTARNAVLSVFDKLRHGPPFACEQEAFPDGQPDGLPFVRLDDDARELFLEWRAANETVTRDETTPPGLSAALSKYRKHTPALALIVHALDGGTGEVTRLAMLKARTLADYFESHTRRVFDSGRRPMIEAARAILRRLERGDLPAEGFTLRDVYRAGWSGLTDRPTVADAVAMLGDYGHLDAERIDTQGRPSEVFAWRRSE